MVDKIKTHFILHNFPPKIVTFIRCGKTQNALLCFHCKNGHATHTLPVLLTVSVVPKWTQDKWLSIVHRSFLLDTDQTVSFIGRP
jgi:hypothetical protein